MNYCRKLASGKYEIVVNGEIIRKASGKAFPCAYDFGQGNIRLSDDSQLRRLLGAPIIIELAQEPASNQ
jgi:hypothetical protein